LRLAIAAIAAALAFAEPAAGATVGTSAGCHRECLANVGFEAAPGEANRLTARIGRTTATFRDDGAPLTAGPGCRSLSSSEAACEMPGSGAYSRLGVVRTGDGDDVVDLVVEDWLITVDLGAGADRFRGAAPIVDGGDGPDDLSAASPSSLGGGAGDDRLTGSSGGDFLVGGEGGDVMAAGGGDDRVELGDGTADLADGGDGTDELAYTGAGAPVTADLSDASPEGTSGEGDVATGFERLEGGRFDDVLGGDAGSNRLVGGRGSDRLDARAGDDVLVPAFDDPPDLYDGAAVDRDTLLGGAGDDRLGAARDQRVDQDCGPGRDVVRVGPGARVRLAKNCEDPALALGPHEAPVRRLGAGRLRVGCPVTEPRGVRCTMAATASRAGRRLGSGRVRLRRGRAAVLSLGRRARGRLELTLSVSDGRRPRFRSTLDVVLPARARRSSPRP
jgi:Ca2+-binding RTX toxin-like protein